MLDQDIDIPYKKCYPCTFLLHITINVGKPQEHSISLEIVGHVVSVRFAIVFDHITALLQIADLLLQSNSQLLWPPLPSSYHPPSLAVAAECSLGGPRRNAYPVKDCG